MTSSTPLILNGRDVANEVLKAVKIEICNLKSNNKRMPGLAVILIGDNPASHFYVKNKEKTCNELDIKSFIYKFPPDVKEDKILENIDSLNKDANIDGILLQLPLPSHLSTSRLISNINPEKDVDGLHPYNLGKLLSGYKCLKPCTPQGVIEILNHYEINIEGLNAVIIGRSTLVGKPLSLLLLSKNATVTILHSKSKNIQEYTRNSDILISAVGNPKFIKQNWAKPGSIIIDVGITQVQENGKNKLVGDVDFDSVSLICKAITPVPGGVGQVTVAMLMKNTLEAYKNRG